MTSRGMRPWSAERSVGVVIDSVLLSQWLGLLYRGEQLNIEELIPELAVGLFQECVFPG